MPVEYRTARSKKERLKMCMTKICKICGDKFPTADMRVNICPKQECQSIKRKRNSQKKLEQSRIENCHTHCKWCGEKLIIGSKRVKFCSDKCKAENLADRKRKEKQKKEYDQEYYLKTKSVEVPVVG